MPGRGLQLLRDCQRDETPSSTSLAHGWRSLQGACPATTASLAAMATRSQLDSLIDDNLTNWSAGEFFFAALDGTKGEERGSLSDNNPLGCY